MDDMISFKIFTSMWNYIISSIEHSVENFGDHLVLFVAAPLGIAATIYFLLLGFAVLRGAIQAPLRELVFQAGKVGFALAAASSTGYTTFVINIATNLPEQIIAAGTGQQSVSNPGQTFDNYVLASTKVSRVIFNQGEKIKEGSSDFLDFAFYIYQALYYFIAMIAIIFISFVAIISASIGFCIVIYAKLAMSICIALAPLALACLLFNSSRWLFDGWLKQTINYIILMVIMSIITTFISDIELKVANDIVASLGEGKSLLSGPEGKFALNFGKLLFIVLEVIIIYIFGSWFFFQAPSIAAGIAGGSTSGGHNFIQTGMDRAAAAATRVAARKISSNQKNSSQNSNSQSR